MSAIGLLPRQTHPRYFIASHADYRREHFIFERTQSCAMRALEWENRVKPMRSWSGIILPWTGFAILAGAALGIAQLFL